jgi:predicted RNA binding protein YcfA (HicA-like mRNA interferase family)
MTLYCYAAKDNASNKDFERPGFVNCGARGSHHNFVHPKATKPITIFGELGDDVGGRFLEILH